MTPEQALELAIANVPAKSRRSDLARALGISPAAIAVWDGKVPAARVHQVVAACGGVVQPHDLRPDIFKAPENGAVANPQPSA